MGSKPSKPEEIVINNANGNANGIAANIAQAQNEEAHRDFHQIIILYTILALVFGIVLSKAYKIWKRAIINQATK